MYNCQGLVLAKIIFEKYEKDKCYHNNKINDIDNDSAYLNQSELNFFESLLTRFYKNSSELRTQKKKYYQYHKYYHNNKK